jgi:homocysteine S-methyltransferase
VARALADLGADVIGLNCSVGPAVMLDALEEMAEAASVPLSAQPNAGVPRTVRDRQIYMASPEYMAEYARRMIQLGVRFLGGCCGTTPEHVRALRALVGESAAKPATRARVSSRRTAEGSATVEPVALAERSRLGAKLAKGGLVSSVEIRPPHSWNPSEVVEPACALASAGVDVLTLVDTARTRIRMGALAAAAVVQRDAGIEAVVHYTCRGPYPDATEVFDIDSIGLTHVVQGLNRGVDPGGTAIGAPTRFVQGVVVSEGAQDRSLELSRFAYKLEAGANFAVTQPVFDVADLVPFLELAAQHRTPVIAGILPFPSLRTAELFANEMPGISVPASVVERMRRAEAKGENGALEEGVQIALETIEAARALVRGFHVSAPRRDVGVALRVLREAGVIAAG